MAKTYSTSTTLARTPIDFELDGTTYHFTPPKTASVILGFAAGGSEGIKGLLNWLSDGLPEDQMETLKARLLDPEDPLDFELVGEITSDLLEQVTEQKTGRPTRPRLVS